MAEIGTTYRLEPWGNNTTYYEGTDDGGKEYILPDDGAKWEVADDKVGCPQLWRNGEHVRIATHSSGLPQLIYDYRNMPVLRPVSNN